MRSGAKMLHRWWIGVRENLRVAWGAIVSNKVRSILTMVIVAVGIAALMSMLTVLNALQSSITSMLNMQMGAPVMITSWSVSVYANGERNVWGGDFQALSAQQCSEFMRCIAPHGRAAFFIFGTSTQLSHGGKQTRPTMRVSGVSTGYADVTGRAFALGRDFTPHEMQQGNFVTVLGWALYEKLFDGQGNPIGQTVSIGSIPYTVVGVLAKQASSFGMDSNDDVLIPYRNALVTYRKKSPDFVLQVAPHAMGNLDQLVEHCEEQMRRVRQLRPAQPSNFNITRSDQILKVVMSSMASVSMASMLIGLVTLFGSAVGLMNIMLASVKSRTQEIGVRKAIGAKAGAIRRQFLIESISITFIGGVAGILLGTVIGSVLANVMRLSFVAPVMWALFSLALAVAVGLLAGYVPAKRAASLDPIEALRYE